ncbi:MAG TPA: hypothetical protein VFJ16_12300 [Longimicrobium sp.]|nr:hypothetical protein [Longimicrobium sp.]
MNTQTHHVHHATGGDHRARRAELARSDAERGAMHGKHRRGLDYTPLFRFLLSRVGAEWDGVYREAAARLDRPDPIFWLVARNEHERREMVRVGESSYFSGLYVDDDGIPADRPAGSPGRGSVTVLQLLYAHLQRRTFRLS